MPREVLLLLQPEQVQDEAAIRLVAGAALGIDSGRITGIRKLRESLDARNRQPRFQLKAEVFVDEVFTAATLPAFEFRNVAYAPEVHIIGAGPAGLFAGLRLLELGLKPVILERGQDVRTRRRDLAMLNRSGAVNPDSNYCFGEGGAGTYSDGKLYTRATKRGMVESVLALLVQHGAPTNILYEAHPHIGTNRLPGIVQAITQTLRDHGAEVHFGAKLAGLRQQFGALTEVSLSGGETLQANAVILATGHSARDIFRLLHHTGIPIEAKAFALGVRVEHSQALIDRLQYHTLNGRGPYLPPAAYSLTAQANGRGIYSFCMCPGGIIAPAATAPGEVVVNGWSPSKRNNPFANSGMVVSVGPEDFIPYAEDGPLAGLAFQAALEQAAYTAGGGALVAPAQRLTDFLQGKLSASLPTTSYVPGILAADLTTVLPQAVVDTLKQGLKLFGRQMPGYITEEAVLVGVESRTSSPVRIPRDKLSFMHPTVNGLFPCGEGAGFAGGIVSAALDGIRCAEAAASYLKTKTATC